MLEAPRFQIFHIFLDGNDVFLDSIPDLVNQLLVLFRAANHVHRLNLDVFDIHYYLGAEVMDATFLLHSFDQVVQGSQGRLNFAG